MNAVTAESRTSFTGGEDHIPIACEIACKGDAMAGGARTSETRIKHHKAGGAGIPRIGVDRDAIGARPGGACRSAHIDHA